MVTKEEILKSNFLKDLNRLIAICNRCTLYREKKCDVFGTGSLNAKIMFIGEAPGREEDKVGKPFIGRAGKFLNLLFSEAGAKREDCFITNLVKHRPFNNRKPKRQEIDSCYPYLLRQIEIIDPELIVLLGNVALDYIFPKKNIGKCHGSFLEKEKRVYFSLYHPAAAIYNQKLKNTLIDDFKKIKNYKNRI